MRVEAIKPFKHQLQSIKFMRNKPAVFDASDPGLGKTLVQILDFAERHKKDGKAALVFCPKSIIHAAWANDIKKFAPHLRVFEGYSETRKNITNVEADVYVMNIDGVKDIEKIEDKKWWVRIGTVIVDESTSVKHASSARSKAMKNVMKKVKWRRCMSGTAAPNGICDLWHQYYILDGGARLGGSFYGFKTSVCDPVPTGENGERIEWVDKPGIELVVGELVKDITIRHKFEDCVDIPPNHRYAVSFVLSPAQRKLYDELQKEQLLRMGDKKITAVNAAVLANKLLQCSAGAVYTTKDENNRRGKEYAKMANERSELVLDLVEAREHSLVFYQWDHQRDGLVAEAEKRGIRFAVWDPDDQSIEKDFQAGAYQALFAHPQSAGHGLTFTKAVATIWASPTHNLEHFLQGLRRIYRIGQKEKTETIVVVAEGTQDEWAWEHMQEKEVNLVALLSEMQQSMKG